jgi:hypothetical protein
LLPPTVFALPPVCTQLLPKQSVGINSPKVGALLVPPLTHLRMVPPESLNR